MTGINPATPAGQPDDSEPRDVLDFIDETVARITDDDIEDRLHKTLRHAGYGQQQHTAADLDFRAAFACSSGTQGALFRQATDEVSAARREARRIIAGAREEAEKALSEAAKIVRDAQELAGIIISDAHSEAQKIRAGIYARKALTAPRGHDEVIRVRDSSQQLRDLQDLIAKLDDVDRKLAIPVRAWHDKVTPRGH